MALGLHFGALGWHLVRTEGRFDGTRFAFGLHVVLFRALGLQAVAFLPLGGTWFALRGPRLAVGSHGGAL